MRQIQLPNQAWFYYILSNFTNNKKFSISWRHEQHSYRNSVGILFPDTSSFCLPPLCHFVKKKKNETSIIFYLPIYRKNTRKKSLTEKSMTYSSHSSPNPLQFSQIYNKLKLDTSLNFESKGDNNQESESFTKTIYT